MAGYGLDSCGLDGYRLDGGGLKDLTACVAPVSVWKSENELRVGRLWVGQLRVGWLRVGRLRVERPDSPACRLLTLPTEVGDSRQGAEHPTKGKSRQAVSVWKSENELRV